MIFKEPFVVESVRAEKRGARTNTGKATYIKINLKVSPQAYSIIKTFAKVYRLSIVDATKELVFAGIYTKNKLRLEKGYKDIFDLVKEFEQYPTKEEIKVLETELRKDIKEITDLIWQVK